MKHILCYGDSNTWGSNPDPTDTQSRFPLDVRWTGRLQELLGGGYRVIEEGLGGRTTVFPDYASEGRNGLDWLCPCLQTHQPLDLVVTMLGTNDTKPKFGMPVEEIAQGMQALVKVIRNPFTYSCGKIPQVLVVSPILVSEDVESFWFSGIFDRSSSERSRRLAGEYRRISEEMGCHFFDAATVAEPGCDGVHLDARGHGQLAEALAEKIRLILQE